MSEHIGHVIHLRRDGTEICLTCMEELDDAGTA
jgi:hypothetical protein